MGDYAPLLVILGLAIIVCVGITIWNKKKGNNWILNLAFLKENYDHSLGQM